MMEKLSAADFAAIRENLRRIRDRIDNAAVKNGRDPSEVRLMAVTKTVPPEQVNAAIAGGVALLGENRAQELCAKYDSYDRDGVEIHFIGHLQTNKVRQIADKVSMVHSVDSLRLAEEIDRQCAKLGKTMEVLAEVNIGREASKSGIFPEEAEEFARGVAQYASLRMRGFMAIPPIGEDKRQIEQYFSEIKQLSVDIQAKKIDNISIEILSMGMSGDFEEAVKHGSHIVRVGTALFGKRYYGI